MSRGKRPVCIGMIGAEDDCEICEWSRECQEMANGIDSTITRKGTHARIVSKYKEKKYKPRGI